MQVIENALDEESFIRLVLSPPRTLVRKIKKSCYQIVERHGAQEFHKNVDKPALIDWLKTVSFKQVQLFTTTADYHLFFPGKVIKKPPTEASKTNTHNRTKQRLLTEAPRDKQRQIEKFLQEVQACLAPLKEKKRITVVDFECGKAYLTFALYEFLSRSFEVEMIGIDLKESVMKECQQLAEKRGFSLETAVQDDKVKQDFELESLTAGGEHCQTISKFKGLTFICGAIHDLKLASVDIAIALHACDTATDAALQKALSLKAKVILIAPCCQHELYSQIDHPDLRPLLKHGILRERIAALITDAARGAFLEAHGYTVRIVEFVDASHTPKNILIRALHSGVSKCPKSLENFENFKDAFKIPSSFLK